MTSADHHHEDANRNAAHSSFQVVVGDRPILAKLRQHARHPADRALHHGRPKRHVEAKFEQRGIQIFFAIELQEITESLERPERNSDGEKNSFEQRQR